MYSVAVTPEIRGRTLTKRNIVRESGVGRRSPVTRCMPDQRLQSQRLKSELRSLITLVPARVLKLHIMELNCADDSKDASTRTSLSGELYFGAVLFADISGFSKLGEILVQKCHGNLEKAAEELSGCIGRNLDKMVHVICEFGGDIIKFAGDAILAVFSSGTFCGDRALCALAASEAAFACINLKLSGGDENVQLGVHCGIGVGDVMGFTLGGLRGRWEYVVSGPAVYEMAKAEPQAKRGEVCTAVAASEWFAPHYALVPVGKTAIKLRPKDKTIHEQRRGSPWSSSRSHIIVPERLPVNSLLWNMSTKQMENLKESLSCYIPRPVILNLTTTHSKWVAELRVASVLFVRIIGLKFDIDTDSVISLGTNVEALQNAIYRYHGTLCRIIVDDKGCGALVGYGLPPFSHKDMQARAVRAALGIVRSLKKLKTKSSVGVTDGRVFVGTVGGEQRCEYTLHGTSVNLAARLMGKADGTVLCSESMQTATVDCINYGQAQVMKVKGKDSEIKAYEALTVKTTTTSSMIETFIGRKLEMGIIASCITTVGYEGSFVYISSAPGLGKSKLLSAACDIARRKGVLACSSACNEFERGTTLFAWRSLLYAFFLFDLILERSNRSKTVQSMLSDSASFADYEYVENPPLHLLSLIFPIEFKDGANENAGVDPQVRMIKLSDLISRLVSAACIDAVTLYADQSQVKEVKTSSGSAFERMPSRRDFASDHLGISYQKNKLQEMDSVDSAHESFHDTLVLSRRAGRVLFTIDDVDFCDAASLVLLRDVFSRHRFLALMLASRESVHISPVVQNMTTFTSASFVLELGLMKKSETSKMIASILKVSVVDSQITELIFEKSKGHPLFTQDLTTLLKMGDTVLEFTDDGAICILSREVQNHADEILALPYSISGLLTCRIDKLTHRAQLTLKTASVIGNVFEIDALHQVRPQIDQDDDRPYGYFDLKEDMDELIEGGFVTVYSLGVDGTLPTWNNPHKTVSLRGAHQAIIKSEDTFHEFTRRPSSLGFRRSATTLASSKNSLRDLAVTNAKRFEVLQGEGKEKRGRDSSNSLVGVRQGHEQKLQGADVIDNANEKECTGDEAPKMSGRIKSTSSQRSVGDVVIETEKPQMQKIESCASTALDVSIYRFAETLMRETAYENMLYKQRRDVHSRCVDYFLRTNSENLEQISTLLANHTLKAERWDDAKTYLCLVGNYSSAENDHALVLWCFQKLLDISSKLKTPPTALETATWKRMLGSTYLDLGKITIGKKLLEEALIIVYFSTPRSQCELHFEIFKLEYCGSLLFAGMEKTALLEAGRSLECMAGIYLGNGERDLCYHSIMSAYQMTKAAGQSCELARYSAFLSTFLVHEQLRYGSSSQLLGRSHMHAQEALDILNRKVECGNEDHETALLVRYRCSQYAVQTSRWKMARKLLHKTRWICDFLMRDVMFNKTIRLQLVVAYFCGNLRKCTKLASTLRKCNDKKDKTVLIARSYVELGDLDSARSLMTTTQRERLHSRYMQNSSSEFRTDCGSVVSSGSARTKSFSSALSTSRSFPITINGCYVLSRLQMTAETPGERAEYIRTAARGVALLAERKHLPIVDFQACVGLSTILLATASRNGAKQKEAVCLGGSKMLERASVQSLLGIISQFSLLYPVCKPHERFVTGLHHMYTGEVAKANRSWEEAMALGSTMKMSHVEAMSCFALSKYHEIESRRKQLKMEAEIKLGACGMNNAPGYI